MAASVSTNALIAVRGDVPLKSPGVIPTPNMPLIYDVPFIGPEPLKALMRADGKVTPVEPNVKLSRP
jgi:hypothetical protein